MLGLVVACAQRPPVVRAVVEPSEETTSEAPDATQRGKRPIPLQPIKDSVCTNAPYRGGLRIFEAGFSSENRLAIAGSGGAAVPEAGEVFCMFTQAEDSEVASSAVLESGHLATVEKARPVRGLLRESFVAELQSPSFDDQVVPDYAVGPLSEGAVERLSSPTLTVVWKLTGDVPNNLHEVGLYVWKRELWADLDGDSEADVEVRVRLCDCDTAALEQRERTPQGWRTTERLVNTLDQIGILGVPKHCHDRVTE